MYASSMLHVMTRYTSKKSSCNNFVVILHQWKKDSLNVSILHTGQKYASDVTSWRYSRFQGKIIIPGYKLRDSLQFMHRKMREKWFWKFWHIRWLVVWLSVLTVVLLNASSTDHQRSFRFKDLSVT